MLIFQELAPGSDRAGNKMAVAGVEKFWFEARALVLTMDTAGVKVTPGGWIDWTGHITLKDLTAFFQARIRDGYRRQQGVRVRVKGSVVQRIPVSHLHHPTQVHHGDAV